MIERRSVTSRERFTAMLGTRPAARILLEAATESEWVARHLEALGHTVIAADPSFAAMYATRSKRVKTDKRDARTLCEALQLGAYRAIHRASDEQRQVRAQLAVRDALGTRRARCSSWPLVRPKFSFSDAVSNPYIPLRRRLVLATLEREQKTEQHLEIGRLSNYVPWPHSNRMGLDAALRFTELQGDQ